MLQSPGLGDKDWQSARKISFTVNFDGDSRHDINVESIYMDAIGADLYRMSCNHSTGAKYYLERQYTTTVDVVQQKKNNIEGKLLQHQLQHNSSAVLGMNSHCTGIGQIRPPRESGTMGQTEMPFGMFDYLRDPTKSPM